VGKLHTMHMRCLYIVDVYQFNCSN